MAASKKTMLLVCLLVVAVAIAVPVAQATIDLSGLISTLLGIIRIQGIVYCSVNGTATIGAGGVTVTPPFSNATVQLRCGAGNGTLVASVQTNNLGTFSILLDTAFASLTQLLSGCRIVVATPLANCNATLPATGTLTSPLTLLGTTVAGLVPVINLGIPRLAINP